MHDIPIYFHIKSCHILTTEEVADIYRNQWRSQDYYKVRAKKKIATHLWGLHKKLQANNQKSK